jgi:hypothetical protein
MFRLVLETKAKGVTVADFVHYMQSKDKLRNVAVRDLPETYQNKNVADVLSDEHEANHFKRLLLNQAPADAKQIGELTFNDVKAAFSYIAHGGILDRTQGVFKGIKHIAGRVADRMDEINKAKTNQIKGIIGSTADYIANRDVKDIDEKGRPILGNIDLEPSKSPYHRDKVGKAKELEA